VHVALFGGLFAESNPLHFSIKSSRAAFFATQMPPKDEEQLR